MSRQFGFDRGTPIDRWYIEQWLDSQRNTIRGRLLEVGDDRYTRMFGSAVTRSDVLHAEAGNERATVVADLQTGDGIADGAYDCVIAVQTLQFIPDMPAAIATIRRILRPGGVLLATGSGISQLSSHDADRWGEYWRVTEQGMQHLCRQFTTVDVQAFGNVVTAAGFLHGVAAEELSARELAHRDREYPVVVCARCVS